METNTYTASRRNFLKATGGFTLYIGVSGILPGLISCEDPKKLEAALKKEPLTAWVKLSSDGEMVIFNPAAEMGQGSMTALPAIFAEEMDADWSKVHVEFSPQVTEVYGSPGWAPGSKLMFTVGSRTTNSYFDVMRRAGAEARYILLYSASKTWGVPMGELTTEPGYVVHPESDRRLGYGEIASGLQIPETLPENIPLKKSSEYRLVGQDLQRTELPEKVNGRAQFAIDIRLPDMVYGVLERGDLHGAAPELQNEAEILGMDGVLKIIRLDYAIGLIATSLEGALEAKKNLRISWGTSAASGFDSGTAYREYEKIAAGNARGEVIVESGDVDKAFNSAARRITADFKNDYIYHAQMEPLNAVVQVAADGGSAEVWVGSQQGPDSKLGVPELLGIPPENVTINLQYLGGGFGRRSMNDFVSECVLLAQEVAPKPVKLIWTREDDVRYGAFRPMSLQRVTAGVDSGGKLTGFAHCVVGDGGNLVASGIRNDHYRIPNQLAEWREARHGIRLKHWRSVGHGPNKFAIEHMLDLVATDLKKDPVALRRELMADAPRALATLDKVAEMADWDTPAPEGRARGVAFVEHGSLGSGICEISLDRDTGKITVHHFWCAVDPGIAVQPDNIKAQIEGGIIMGMSSVLSEQITIRDGRVQQSNYSDYRLLRMQDAPESIETVILGSDQHPEGVGETGTPLVAGAIANAFLKLTGKSLRHLPFTPERVLEVLNA
ncbi:xanthine dehydrogenase family protein molybdopterin-binding subunit [Robiginitalea sp. SC105]|uniref:xanthine dehydrogenase family protein molybdopterin-binding subunit n=1 Tax=Robiginitalea sp. SC105 TaxID=2762332 RepID=UPI00163B40A6|nr:molybdopterin cofactor-binding domain-containing protein [Robiginitalea sp. SC105]MBC2839214.1 xanthine dehydrogenase family protein molybdopterin-binding subunit [Robiginitalea sp. SC105]